MRNSFIYEKNLLSKGFDMKFVKLITGIDYDVRSDANEHMGLISVAELIFYPTPHKPCELPLHHMIKITDFMKSLLKEDMDTSFPA